MSVHVIHFNPLRRRPGLAGRLLPRRPLNNFGDLLGPLLVEQIVAENGISQPEDEIRLVAVGSIMKLAKQGDTVWGAGINGKSLDTGAAPELDVRAVRGPRTRELLMARGTEVPEVYGDPGLLWSKFWPIENYRFPGHDHTLPVSVVPNFHDRTSRTNYPTIDPLQDPHTVAKKIAMSEFVCGSSLHGVVIAESLGIPARLIRSGIEPAFKYDDYYSGTGRPDYRVAETVEDAIEMGGERPPSFDAAALIEAFPFDIYDKN